MICLSSRELLQHMNLHGVKESEELSVQEKEQSVRQYHNVDVSPGKRYKCAGCPYVSNSKSQFLYHKQFHRPRGAPFKCGLCSYNVSRRHLLHQHLRVHGILVPPQKTSLVKTDQTHHEHVEEVQPLCRAPHAAVDTRGMADVPLVWVSRGDKFFKMFKCRYCPHVNLRKVNIQEHEKMHRARGGLEQDESMASPQQQHHCPDCNYICNNAGVLSSHAKVHQGVYGHVHCLVDSSKPDSDQVTKLRQYLYEDGDVLSAHDEQIQSYDEDEDDEQNMSRSILNTNQSDEQKDFLAEMQLIANDSGQLQEEQQRRLFFCSLCPARFLFEKELAIHKRFHEIRLAHRCESCSYAARQRHHLLSHLKVHSEEYQQRTVTLSAMYPTSPDHPQPNTAVVMEGTGVAGPLWIVIAGRTTTTLSESTKPAPVKQYPCYMCPAKFFKSVALEYHLSLHGGDGPHKCRRCNYAVKTLGNLAKHEMVHNATEGPQEASHLSPAVIVQQSVPLSGTDLFERKEAQKQSLASGVPVYQPPLHVDPQFGILMHGNPEYIYPTYLKNGRLKEKRYKCHKCPSAFEKREQYKVHLSLHGSKQRYKCEKCDYSVKYYANYIQHMRKHQNNEEAQAAKKVKEGMPLQPGVLAPLEEVGMGTEEPLVTSPPFQPRPVKSIGWSASSNGEPQAQSATERQVALLQQFRRQAGPPEDENRRAFPCLYCPYSSPRKDGLDSHVRRHLAVSGTLSAHTCSHCDYTATQLHFLRDHVRVHFDLSRRPRPEAYMKCERLELTAYSEGDGTEPPDKVLLFRDCGEPLPHDERFEPIYSPGLIESGDDTTKVFIDISTGLSKVTSEAMEPDSMVKVVQDVKLEDDEEEVLVRADKSSDAVIVVSDDAVKSEKESDSSNSTSSSYSSGSSSSSSSSSNNTKSSSTSDSDSQTGDDKRSRSKECELLDNVREEKTRTLSEDEDSCEEESKVLGNVCEVKTRTLSEDEDSCEEENKLLDNVSESGDSELKIKLSCKLSEDSSEVSDWE
uniref:C2H2-type domain-containing protein n=1 Tax=Timema cristinae TaxID=61476 RepID=A0A7R9DC43_TIMCR|nr:unnamed protein product [Timema cristinae]